MITHVSLRNFQSWKALDIELGRITVIVGKGNAGKSAIIRALKYALTNKGGDSFIRHGEEEAAVGLAFEDQTLLWRKRQGKGGAYDFNGQSYSKTGTTIPPEIANGIGVRGVAIDNTETLYPQIHSQFDAPFIVKASGTKRARILGKLTKLDVLVQAQMLARRDLERTAREEEARQNEQERLESALHELPDVPTLKSEYEKLPVLLAQIEQARVATYTLDILRAIQDKETKYAMLEEAVVVAIEELTDYEQAYNAVDRWANASSNYADVAVEFDRLVDECEKAEAKYEATLAEQGICEACPLRRTGSDL